MPAGYSRRGRRHSYGSWRGPTAGPTPAWMTPSLPSSSRPEIGRSRRRAPRRPQHKDPLPMKRAASTSSSNTWAQKLRRIRALVVKETRQVVRDPSSIAMGVVLPLILILLFGYGLSLDVKNVPIAVVMEYPGPEAMELSAGFQLSPYFHPTVTRSMPSAQDLLLRHQVDGIVRIPADFSRRVGAGEADVQLIVHGGDANRARIIEGYVQGVGGAWSARLAAEGQSGPVQPVNVQSRLWFNEANASSYFLVPGLIVL